MLMALLIALLPVIGLRFGHDHTIDIVFLGLAFLFGGLSIRSGFRVHGRWGHASWFLAGIALVCLAHFGLHEGAVSYALSMVGGGMMVWFHRLNLRLSAECGCPTCAKARNQTP